MHQIKQILLKTRHAKAMNTCKKDILCYLFSILPSFGDDLSPLPCSLLISSVTPALLFYLRALDRTQEVE